MVWEPRLSLTYSSDGDDYFEMQGSQKQPYLLKGFPTENSQQPIWLQQNWLSFDEIEVLLVPADHQVQTLSFHHLMSI